MDSASPCSRPRPTPELRGEDDVRLWLLRLAEVLNLTVESVTVDADVSLSLLFAGGITLKIAAGGAHGPRRTSGGSGRA